MSSADFLQAIEGDQQPQAKRPREATIILNINNSFSINQPGDIAFIAGVSSGGVALLYDDLETGLEVVARTGSSFLGSTITQIEFAGTSQGTGVLGRDRDGLNDVGEVAFQFELADGREGIALWSSLPKPVGGSGNITPVSRGFRVRFPGIPGWDYLIERDEDLLAPWERLAIPITADPSGWVTFEDLGPGLPERRFYRCFKAP